jgi:hypothetical protein
MLFHGESPASQAAQADNRNDKPQGSIDRFCPVSRQARALVRKPHFYEKVVKVKADVAAILKFFLPIPQIEGDMAEAAPRVPIGGMRKGGFSGAL